MRLYRASASGKRPDRFQAPREFGARARRPLSVRKTAQCPRHKVLVALRPAPARVRGRDAWRWSMDEECAEVRKGGAVVDVSGSPESAELSCRDVEPRRRRGPSIVAGLETAPAGSTGPTGSWRARRGPFGASANAMGSVAEELESRQFVMRPTPTQAVTCDGRVEGII